MPIGFMAGKTRPSIISSESSFSAAANNTRTIGLIVPSGVDMLVAALTAIQSNDVVTMSTPQFDGSPMNVARAWGSVGNGPYVSMWYILNPATLVRNITFNNGGGPNWDSSGGHVWYIKNGKTIGLTGGASSTTGSGPLDITLNPLAAKPLILAHHSVEYDSGGGTPGWAYNNLISDFTNFDSGQSAYAVGHADGQAGSFQVGFDISGWGTNLNQAMQAIAVHS